MSEERQSPIPVFEDAIEHFRSFLYGQHVETNIRWIWRDDVLVRRRRISRASSQLLNTTWSSQIYVDCSRPNDEPLARQFYHAATVRGLGVALCAFCRCNDSVCCYIDVPHDTDDAEYKMIYSLNCMLRNPLPAATAVHRSIRWWAMRTVFQASSRVWIEHIPLRSGI